jgi:superfamily II DNA or RNA helicase
MTLLPLNERGSASFRAVSPNAIEAGSFNRYALNPLQLAAKDKLRLSILAGHRRIILQAPTGFGKTISASDIIDGALTKSKRVIFCVPSIGLVDQTLTKFFNAGIFHIGVIQADHPQTDPTAPVQIASVQTLCRRKALPEADIVLIDEVHIWFDFYAKWMARPEWKDTLFIGLSATPWTKGLGRHFTDLVIAATLKDMIEAAYLCSFRAFAPKSHLKPDLSGVRTLAGDFHEGQLSAEMQKPALIADCVQNWLENGEGRPTLVFCVDRAHAANVQEAFEKAGVPTAYIDAFTSRNERTLIGQRLESGDVQIVVNIATCIYGIDWPFLSCIIWARPTMSEMLFVQGFGRGLRTDPKNPAKDLLFFDHTNTITDRLGFPTDIIHETLEDGERKNGKKAVRDREDKAEKLPKECPKCGRLKPAGERKCKDCGFEPRKPSELEFADGELIQVSGKQRKESAADRQEWWSGLLWISESRGYRPGWAAHKYQEKFGGWPRGLRDLPRPPSPEVTNWVKSRQIAWAKAARSAAC